MIKIVANQKNIEDDVENYSNSDENGVDYDCEHSVGDKNNYIYNYND